jgi:hypothetical protein
MHYGMQLHTDSPQLPLLPALPGSLACSGVLLAVVESFFSALAWWQAGSPLYLSSHAPCSGAQEPRKLGCWTERACKTITFIITVFLYFS